MAPVPPHPMSIYEARKASFLVKEAASGPSRKKAAAAATKQSWPHPFSARSNDRAKGSSSDESSQRANGAGDAYPSPRSLANLGLYYDPTPDATDRCSVYPDGHSIANWSQGQSALERLEEEDPLISWVMIERSKRCSEEMAANDEGKLLWSRQRQDMYPTGKAMIDARLRTYGGAWPLDGKKGWKPTSKKLASAGFYFSPNEDEEDCVSCAYCQCSLGGWEKADDPVKEHQKRRPGCAVFVSELEKAEKKQEGSTRTANSSVVKGRTTSRKRAAEPEEVVEERESSSAPVQNKSSLLKLVPEKGEEAANEETNEEAKPAPKKRKKAVAAKAKGTSKRTPVEAPLEEEEEALALTGVEADEEEIRELPPKTKTKKAATKKAPPKKKTAAKKVAENNTSEMELDGKEVEADDFEEAPSRSHSRDSGKDVDVAPVVERAETPSTSVEPETFKTPKQTASGRTTEKTPIASSPMIEKPQKVAKAAVETTKKTNATSAMQQQGGAIASLEKLDTLSLREKSMTVEEYLRMHVKKACSELKAEGKRRIEVLEGEMAMGRIEAERILRGIYVN